MHVEEIADTHLTFYWMNNAAAATGIGGRPYPEFSFAEHTKEHSET